MGRGWTAGAAASASGRGREACTRAPKGCSPRTRSVPRATVKRTRAWGIVWMTSHVGAVLSLLLVVPIQVLSRCPSLIESAPMPRFVVCAVTAVLAAVHVGAANAQSRITNASTVRLRNAPSTTAAIAAKLSLGTELVVLERTNQADLWYHVRTDDGRHGWVLGSLTTPFDHEHPNEAIESIVLERLSSGVRMRGTTFFTRPATQGTPRTCATQLDPAWLRGHALPNNERSGVAHGIVIDLTANWESDRAKPRMFVQPSEEHRLQGDGRQWPPTFS
jgi:Bacterial SH3 domain